MTQESLFKRMTTRLLDIPLYDIAVLRATQLLKHRDATHPEQCELTIVEFMREDKEDKSRFVIYPTNQVGAAWSEQRAEETNPIKVGQVILHPNGTIGVQSCGTPSPTTTTTEQEQESTRTREEHRKTEEKKEASRA